MDGPNGVLCCYNKPFITPFFLGLIMGISGFEEAQKSVVDIGKFSVPLQDILSFMLKDFQGLKQEFKKENEARKAEMGEKFKELESRVEQDSQRMKEILKREVFIRATLKVKQVKNIVRP